MKKVWLWIGLIVWFFVVWGALYVYERYFSTTPTQSIQQTTTFQKDSLPLIDSTMIETNISKQLWDTLMDIRYDQLSTWGYQAHFEPKHERLHQKEVVLEGYMHPIEDQKLQHFFMLSRFPRSQCFFCGGAGPESIVEINSPKGVLYTDQKIQLKGMMTLNKNNKERLFYILEKGRRIKN
jgi:hypothetical protein